MEEFAIEINAVPDNKADDTEKVERVNGDKDSTDKLGSLTDKREETTDRIEEATEETKSFQTETKKETIDEDIAVHDVDNRGSSIPNNDSLGDDNAERDREGNESDDEDDEETEDEEAETEITLEEKRAMYEAVRSGDIDALEDCLDLPNSDINILWYKENLLMTAVRHGHEEMAKFLLDNGVDHTYSTSVMEMKETPRGILLDRYDLSCRQMAYDYGLVDIVQLIDHLQGNLFPFVHPPERTQRQRRQRRTSVSESDDSSCNDSGDDGDDDNSSSGPSDHDNSTIINPDTVSEDETVSQSVEKKTRKKNRDYNSITNADSEKINDEEATISAWDDKHGDGNQNEDAHESVKRKRKKKAAAEVTNNSVTEDKVEKEEIKTADAVSRHNSQDSAWATPSMLSPQKKDQMDNMSNEKLNLSQTNRNMDTDTVPQNTTFQNGHFLKELNHLTQLLGVPQSSSTPPDQKPARAAKLRHRCLSPKFAQTLRGANRRPSDCALQGTDQSRPLRWTKVSSPGSYSSESKRWHRKEKKRPRSTGDCTEISLIDLSKSPSPGQKNCKHYFDLSTCVRQHEKTCSVCSTHCKLREPTRLSDVNNLATKASMDIENCQPNKYKSTKKKISPRFMNSYEVLAFIPDARAS